MTLADLGDAGEALRYLVGFWGFLFSPSYRAQGLRRWREAPWPDRSLMLLGGALATVLGLGLPLLVAWFIVRA